MLYKGCPEFYGICRLSKGEVREDFKKHFPQISDADLAQWIEINIDDKTSAWVLPASAPYFKGYIAISVSDLGVLMKYINDLKRKIPGSAP